MYNYEQVNYLCNLEYRNNKRHTIRKILEKVINTNTESIDGYL